MSEKLSPSELVENLLAEAEDYAQKAFTQFMLEERFEHKKLQNELSEFSKTTVELATGLAQFLNSDPVNYSRFKNYTKFRIHYLFPNLSDSDRAAICEFADAAESSQMNGAGEKEKIHAQETKKKIAHLETKLTSIQLWILDSDEFRIGRN